MIRSAFALLFVSTAIQCGPRPATHVITLATTTSIGNSGLLDVLLPAFQRQHGIDARAHLVGSGLALKMLGRGDVDMVVSHAPAAEEVALRQHPRWHYRKIMFNDFVLVGPIEDPARVKGSSNVEVAMRRIAASTSRFLSRGDQSGTHEREQQLWASAGARPHDGRLVVAGAGMGTTLRIASQTSAYTLTDRATFAQHAGAIRLMIVYDGGPQLINTYAVIVDLDGPHVADAAAFAAWLSDGNGRDVIRGYRLTGRTPAFQIWPATSPRDRSSALPY